jgi:hypothetical protein
VTPIEPEPATLRACTGQYFLDFKGAGQDESSDWAEYDARTTGTAATGGAPGFPALLDFVSFPFEVEIIDESGNPDGRPLDLNWIRFEDPPGGDNVKSEVFICDRDGPVLAIEVLADLLVMHVPFVPYPSSEAPQFMALKNLPFELAPPAAGTMVNRDVYLPVTEDGHFTIANANATNNPWIDMDFGSLSDCASLINLQPPEPEFQINTAISDAWYFPGTDGQGFFIIVWEQQELIFLSWFTYETERPPADVTAILGEPGHRWLTALGSYQGNKALLNVFLSSGMIFDSGSPPVTTEQLEGATIEIIWTECNKGTVKYNIPTLNLSGEIPIERIVLDNVPACIAAQGSVPSRHR